MSKEIFTVLTEPTKSLRERSQALSLDEILTSEFQAYLDKLTETMLAEDGVGIASPQVGRNIRAIIVNIHGQPECWMNPEIIKYSEATVESEEGCLSVPGKYGLVKRFKKISLRAINRHGRTENLELKNFPAFVFQHEIDHLDGILFIDKATELVSSSAVKI